MCYWSTKLLHIVTTSLVRGGYFITDGRHYGIALGDSSSSWAICGEIICFSWIILAPVLGAPQVVHPTVRLHLTLRRGCRSRWFYRPGAPWSIAGSTGAPGYRAVAWHKLCLNVCEVMFSMDNLHFPSILQPIAGCVIWELPLRFRYITDKGGQMITLSVWKAGVIKKLGRVRK